MSAWLFGCEESQACTIAARAIGVEAYSCDIKPCSGGHPEWHLQMDVFQAIASRTWEVGVFFPDCTFLTCSAEWAYKDQAALKSNKLVGAARRAARLEAIAFFKTLWNCSIPHIAIENPVGVISSLCKPDQIIQPWMFGDDASKGTCLWLQGLPKLITRRANFYPPRIVDGRSRWGNQTDSGQNRLGPSDDRAEIRSKTYPGIANAMAKQWWLYLQQLKQVA